MIVSSPEARRSRTSDPHPSCPLTPSSYAGGTRFFRDPLIETILLLAGGGQRLDILKSLVVAPMSVSALADAVFAKLSAVSRDLGLLEKAGCVTWERDKNTRLYRLTERVNGIPNGDMMQIAISNGMGQWVLIHLDDTADQSRAVSPPEFFIRSERA